MKRTLTKKFVYIIAVVAILSMMIPAMTVPVSAQNGGTLSMVLIDPVTQAAQATADSGYNITGSKVLLTVVPDPGYTVTSWSIDNIAVAPGAGSAHFVTDPGTGLTAQVTGTWGDAEISVNLTSASANASLSMEKKFGQIYSTSITHPGYGPVTWVESTKSWTGNATVTDTVIGDFYVKDAPNHEYVAAQGVKLNWYLIAGNVAVNLAAGEAADLKTRMAGYATPAHVSFASGSKVTNVLNVSNASGQNSITLYAAGEEAVQVVVVPEYPYAGINIPVTPEITSYDFYTTEMDVVPQVRWAGEKIVLEKNFGTSYTGLWVKFSLQNQSVGSLEGISGKQNQVNGTAVWTQIDANGFASVILTSSDVGVSSVSAGLYNNPESGTLINQHYFTVYFLKFESLVLGDVVGKREHHNAGVWQTGNATQPTNPWDPTGSYNGTVSPPIADTATQTLNVSQDALLRARVRGWFTSSNPSNRLARIVDPTNSSVDAANPTPSDLTLPQGRWILPDDWSALAGPNWMQSRLHWDIMCNPDGSVGSANVLGVYKKPYPNGPTVSGPSVIGPFSPGLELMTPTGWTIPNPGYDPARSMMNTTVVPDGKLNYWDAPMPPAKVIFQIQPEEASTDEAGFFKATDKAEVYYILWEDTSVNPHTFTTVYTNPFYKEMIPAHEAIPAFINNGGYDWNSFDSSYGPYMFWQFINQHSYTPLVPTTDPAGHPTNVEVYSDNHGEAMVWLNGNWNLDLSAWSAKGYADIPIMTPVGQTTVQATVDYPYSRVHQAFQSNMDVKTWTWGGEILGTDGHLFGDNTTQTLDADTRLVLSAGNWDDSTRTGTSPNESAKSLDKVVWVFATDRDGQIAGVNGAKVTWTINNGSMADIAPYTGWVSHYNNITKGITLTNGFLSNTNGMASSATVGTSYLIPVTSNPNIVALFNKFWGPNGTSTIKADPTKFVVAAIDIESLTGSYAARVNVNIKIQSHDFDPVMGQNPAGILSYDTDVDFNNLDALDDGIRVGDANYDGNVDVRDITAVERMIMGYNAIASNAVLNTDGSVDMGTVVKIENLILGYK